MTEAIAFFLASALLLLLVILIQLNQHAREMKRYRDAVRRMVESDAKQAKPNEMTALRRAATNELPADRHFICQLPGD